MTLPTEEQLTELSGLIVKEGKRTHGKWYTFKGMKQVLDSSGGDLTVSVIAHGTEKAVSLGAKAGGVATGVAFIPFGLVLAPWIGAAKVVQKSGTIFDLYDVLESYKKGSVGSYKCNCGNCEKNIQYVIDKKERNVARIAIGVGTIGVSSIFTTINSIGKSFQSGRPKEMTSTGLVDSARDNGCTTAMATIFLLSGRWYHMKNADVKTLNTAIAIITSEDGWKELKSRW